MYSENNCLRIAIQKSGRLRQESLKYLYDEFDLSYRGENDALFYSDIDEKVEFLFVREKDIPELITNNKADIGILGENTFLESGIIKENKNIGLDVGLKYYQRLGFSKCRLSFAIPENVPYDTIFDLAGATVATSYPKLLIDYLDQYNIFPNIYPMSGSVEIAPKIGVADVIFDLVETGGTLCRNKLKEVQIAYKSEAVAIFSDKVKTSLNGKDATLQNVMDLPYQSRVEEDMYGKAYTNFPWNCHRSFN